MEGVAEKTLDVNVPVDGQYCIPLWLRDIQIEEAIRRVPGRVQPIFERRTDPIAVVGYGPSLMDTWEKIREFPVVMTCSGAHRFLVERGIVPDFHVEVDPRPHKVELIGPPQEKTQYLIASTCHRAVFDHLEGRDVKLWHVFDASEDGLRMLPPGEWAVTGGCDAGLRAITLAAFLGYRDLHVFGMDGCGRETKHAAAHPNAVKKFKPCEYDGKTYYTTQGLLAAAQQIWHELDAMPAVNATFYGEGLVQHMAKNYVRKPIAELEKTYMTNVIGFQRQLPISEGYRQLNMQLFRDNPYYGVGGAKHAPNIKKLCEALKTTRVLDYGCGRGLLAKALEFPIWEYDPAIPGKQESPRPADIVVCTDVLEHVEPECLDAVLADLKRCTKKVGYFVIHTGPSSKVLADGRNAHILQRDRAWWKQELEKYFTIGKIIEQGPLVTFVVGARGKVGLKTMKLDKVA